ncbi:MAG: IclR family transcriptional regulator [Planctomycetota bacterium]|nr:IclR family transcriptional regulator [Planctomycetota bacterium]
MIQVLNRAFDILDYLSTEPDRPKRLSHIARSLDMNQATCANILKTMVRRGFVDQAAPKRGYTLGPAAYRLARSGVYRKDLVAASEPPMTALASGLRETVLIATLRQYERVIPCQVEGDRDLQVRSDIVSDAGVYQTVTGRLLLSYLPDERLETFIILRGLPGKGVWTGVKTRKQLTTALRNIRKDQKVIDTSQPQIAAAAYPIWQNETVAAALGLFLPKFRFKGEHRRKVLAGLEATAAEITRRLSRSLERNDS